MGPNGSHSVGRQASRFVVVGVVNTGVYYGLYLLLHLGLPYLAAHLLATSLAMIGSFFLNSWWTFHTRPTIGKFLAFPLSNLTNYVVQTFGVVLCVEAFGMDQRFAPLPAAVLAIPVTFLLSRRILVGRQPRT